MEKITKSELRDMRLDLLEGRPVKAERVRELVEHLLCACDFEPSGTLLWPSGKEIERLERRIEELEDEVYDLENQIDDLEAGSA